MVASDLYVGVSLPFCSRATGGVGSSSPSLSLSLIAQLVVLCAVMTRLGSAGPYSSSDPLSSSFLTASIGVLVIVIVALSVSSFLLTRSKSSSSGADTANFFLSLGKSGLEYDLNLTGDLND